MQLLWCAFFANAGAVSPDILWSAPCLVTNYTIYNGSHIEKIAPDGSGGCYVFGTLRGDGFFNGTRIEATNDDLPRFLARLDSNGHLDWIRRLGGGPTNPGLFVDREGTVVLGGVFLGDEANLGDRLVQVGSSGPPLIAAFNPQGHCLWIQKPNLKADDILAADAFDIDKRGNFVIAGGFGHTLTTPAGAVKTRGQMADIFLSRCNTNGAVIVTSTMHGPGRKSVNQIAVDPANAVLVTGNFRESLDVSGFHLEGGKQTAYVAKFDVDGKCEWAEACGGQKFGDGECVVTDDQGNIYLAGVFAESGDFFGKSLRAVGDGDLFICKLSRDGNLIWVRSYGKRAFTGSVNLVFAKSGLVLTGYHEGGGAFQIGNLPTLSASSFLAGFDLQGEPQWVKQLYGVQGTYVFLKQDVRGDLYLSGVFDRLPNAAPNERFVFAVSKIRAR